MSSGSAVIKWTLAALLVLGLSTAAGIAVFVTLLLETGEVVGKPLYHDLGGSQATVTVFGAEPGDGLSQVGTGDFNGDGVQDLVAAARLADGPGNSRQDAGEAYVIFGRPELPQTLDLAEVRPDVTILGGDPQDFMGRDLAMADINGDGLDDVILGSKGDGPNNARLDAGEVYIVFGSSDPRRTIDVAAEEQDVTIVGIDAGDGFGSPVATGDVNGDGVPDLIAGADDAAGPDNSRPDAGEAYVIFGQDLRARIDLFVRLPDITVYGADAGDDFGSTLATGDVNGDGADDLLTSAPDADGPDNGRPDSGEAYVFEGPIAGGTTLDISEGAAAVTLYGIDPADGFGTAMTAADVNGDGTDDIVVGSQFADGPAGARFRAGEVYVVYGSPGISGGVDLALNEQDVTILGADGDDELGSVFSIGSLNDDEVDDLVMGADDADGPGNGRRDAGELYVIFGSSELPPRVDIAHGRQSLTLGAPSENDDLGRFVARGDLDGDGNLDIVIGVPRGDGPGDDRRDAGEVMVLSGADDDHDGVLDLMDNCPDKSNPGQEDTDGDGLGDRCSAAEGAGAGGESGTARQ